MGLSTDGSLQTAINTDVRNQIAPITQKFAPAGADEIVIEDATSAPTYEKRSAQLEDVITTGVEPSYALGTTANGYGSTNTRIIRFSARNDSSGTGGVLAWQDVAADGSSIILNSEGIYTISAVIDKNAAATLRVGINVAAALSNTFNGGHLLAASTTIAATPNSNTATVSWTGYIGAGAKLIWFSVENAVTLSASATLNQVNVTKFGKYNYGA
jgi:hypothetical protein